MSHASNQTLDDQEADTPIGDLLPPDDASGEDVPPAIGKRILQPRTLIAFVIAAAALYFIFKRGFALDFAQIWAEMRRANPLIFLSALLVYYTTFFIRARRWEGLLGNVGYSRGHGYKIPSTFGLAEILYLSWFTNCVTVARLGDAYRSYMLKRAARVSFTVTIGTIIAERLIDLCVLAGMMALSGLIAFHGALPREAEQALLVSIGLTGLGILFLAFLPRLRPLIERLLPARLHDHYANLETGLIGSFRRLPLVGSLSVAAWLIEGSTLYLNAKAIGAPISLVGAIVVALVASLLSTIPFTPAGLGVTETGMVFVLTQLGLEMNVAGAVALLNRLITYWSIVVIGAIVYIFSRKK